MVSLPLFGWRTVILVEKERETQCDQNRQNLSTLDKF